MIDGTLFDKLEEIARAARGRSGLNEETGEFKYPKLPGCDAAFGGLQVHNVSYKLLRWSG